jgi:glucose-6-phosphate 1-dehydrogenase
MIPMSDRPDEPHIFLILGATGDLTRRKLLPALYDLGAKGSLDERALIVGAALPELTQEAFRDMAYGALVAAGHRDGRDLRRWCDTRLFYQTVRQGGAKDYEALAEFVGHLERERRLPGNRALYLALPPGSVPAAIERLGESGLTHSRGWVRIVVEKPFGHDFTSASALDTLLHRYFNEPQIFRIDHYLGKETVQNLLAFRFANPIFESLWNRDKVESVQITVSEDLGVEHRGQYYDGTGALRDMVQNHLTQLMSVVAMEVPVRFEAEPIRGEKFKALRSVSPIHPEDVVFGQYTEWTLMGSRIPGYRDEDGVPGGSTTETYVALKMQIDNWRWQGVPFYLRTGKRLPRKMTQIAVIFCQPPTFLFPSLKPGSLQPNMLLITLQPSEGFSLCFSVKSPGKPFELSPHSLSFAYEDAFGPLADAYETLLRDILIGDQTLFVSAEFTEAAWRLYDPLLKAQKPIHFYPAGSWGPQEATDLLARDGHQWQLGW